MTPPVELKQPKWFMSDHRLWVFHPRFWRYVPRSYRPIEYKKARL